MRSEDEGRFQMLWNCGGCGTEKLLALDHKFCPKCGSPQDSKDRYFPSDDEKIAVEDHPFHGADKICGACDTPNAGNANFCAACACPLDDAKEAARRRDRLHEDEQSDDGESGKDARAEHKQRRIEHEQERVREMSGAPPPKPKATKKKRGKGIIGVAVIGCFGFFGLAVVGMILFAILSSLMATSGDVDVTGHHWKRTVQVEVFGPETKEAWQSAVPQGARDVVCEQAVKEKKKVQDGEKCKTRKIDNGDGTFQQKKECKPTYKQEPVYADKCKFDVDSWKKVRQEQAAGDDTNARWPTVKLKQSGDCIGCEREGEREAIYTVHFTDDEGAKHDCKYPEAKWKGYARGGKYKASFAGLSGALQCGTVK
ncbi:MAG: hypothetical protein ACI9MC_004183 [Kiritimatiellia bacterium]|jgi:hypothetical protein